MSIVNWIGAWIWGLKLGTMLVVYGWKVEVDTLIEQTTVDQDLQYGGM
jgi:hypothetical protein